MRKFFGFAIFAVLALVTAPAQSAGLLQDLFASFERRAAPVVYRYAPAQPQMRFVYDEGFRTSRRLSPRKAVVGSRSALRTRAKGTTANGVIAVKAKASTGQPSQEFEGLNPHDSTTAAIARDTTLRVGDAYMTPQGLRIYRGRASTGQKGAFVDYRKAGIDADMKSRLSAIERAQSARAGSTATNLVTTASVARHNIPSRTSIDATGRIIRVVGP